LPATRFLIQSGKIIFSANLKTDLFDYPLPARLIAQIPADRRDASRLLVVHRAERRIEHRHFRDLPEYLQAGDCLFRNNAAVIPARLHATRPTGGHVECLLLRPAAGMTGLPAEATPSPSRMQCPPSPSLRRTASALASPGEGWWCLVRPGKKLPVGATFGIAGVFTATIREKTDDGLVRVSFTTTDGDILAVANRIGDMPLPPYITGHDNDEARAIDRERYQTVYADRAHQVAAAAPTAGLHFTPELLAQLATAGVRTADLTLHVGLGTFRPIATEHVEDHPIHRELYEITAATQQALFAPAGRRIAVGTTSVRTIEHFLEKNRSLKLGDLSTIGSATAEADTFIYPPRTFRGVDALITNFHQPRSTLLCLVAAFLAPGSADGIAWLHEIYAEAIAREYRFFSYGDAMLIL
jgi:S-adenosylmethionine:tRNA ribosyltransferase-isomerase